MKKMKIDFRKLVDGRYPLCVELEVVNWMLKTGRAHEFRYGWHVRGIDQHLFGYSANNRCSGTGFPLDDRLRMFVELLLFRGVVKQQTPNNAVRAWRECERIGLDRFRMLAVETNDEVGYPLHNSVNNWSLYHAITDLSNYVGAFLQKQHAHPDIPERIDPKIIDIRFATCGEGYFIVYTFSFSNFNYEPGWDEYISQNEGEGINAFVCRVHNEIHKRLREEVEI